MKTTLKKTCIIISWAYATGIILWFVLHSWLGDTVWWLALISTFSPFIFAPLVLLVPIGLIFRLRSFWLSLLPSLAIFSLLYGPLFLPAWPSEPTTIGTPLAVKSFNIWGFSQSDETVQALLDGGPADIVALQELGPQMAELLVEKVGDIYPYHIINIGTQDWGCGVFSRYPLTELDASRLADPNWRVQVFRVKANGQAFILYNVHLQASNVLAYFDSGSSFTDKVEVSFTNREAQARRLMADIATRTEPVIVAGDFNSTDQSDVHSILAAGLTDAHQAVGWGLGHTFPAYSGSWKHIPIIPRQMRIDMIFYSADLTAISCKVGSAHGESDHLPVLAQLAWQR